MLHPIFGRKLGLAELYSTSQKEVECGCAGYWDGLLCFCFTFSLPFFGCLDNIQPLSLVQREVIQMDMKESLEGLETFV